MRLAVLADIHGNWTALREVAAALQQEKVQAVIGLGDYLSVSSGSVRVVEWMQGQERAYFVRGDNDHWTSYERFRNVERADSFAHYQLVTQLPDDIRLEIEGFTLLIQHGYACRPIQENGFTEAAVRETLSRPYVESVVELAGADIACFGDLHRPYVELHEDLVIAHAGSVGAPRDQQPWRAKYLLLDLKDSSIWITRRSVPFCREAAVEELRAGYREDPGPSVWLARWLGLAPGMTEEWQPAWREMSWHWRRQR